MLTSGPTLIFRGPFVRSCRSNKRPVRLSTHLGARPAVNRPPGPQIAAAWSLCRACRCELTNPRWAAAPSGHFAAPGAVKGTSWTTDAAAWYGLPRQRTRPDRTATRIAPRLTAPANRTAPRRDPDRASESGRYQRPEPRNRLSLRRETVHQPIVRHRGVADRSSASRCEGAGTGPYTPPMTAP